MQYDVPKTYLKEKVAEVRSFKAVADEDIANNDPFAQGSRQADNFGGIFMQISGTTAASGTFNSVSNPQWIYIPESGPLPKVEIEQQHMARVLEWSTEKRSYDNSK